MLLQGLEDVVRGGGGQIFGFQIFQRNEQTSEEIGKKIR